MRRSLALAVVAATATPASADTELALYGDTGASIATHRAASFEAGELDLFATASVNRWSFLAETMFEAGDDNEFRVEVERVVATYLHADWLRVGVGRFHSAFGYYNDAFHHGTYFMVSAERPRMVSFEDEGGLIPAHTIGVHADGRVPFAGGKLRYDLELGNGRGPVPSLVQTHVDSNDQKSVDVRLRYEPGGALEGLVVGASAYVDTIPSSSTRATVTARGDIAERLANVHAAYLEHGVHAIAEAMVAEHDAGGTDYRTFAAYAEGGYTLGAYTPYARVEWTRFDDKGDPYYDVAPGTRHRDLTVGVRYLANENIALKLEGRAELDSAERTYGLATQLAFAF